jgi:hypothetical protein
VCGVAARSANLYVSDAGEHCASFGGSKKTTITNRTTSIADVAYQETSPFIAGFDHRH